MVDTSERSALLSFLKPNANLLEAALAYASERMFVLRLEERGKRPIDKAWQKHATTKADDIKSLWGDRHYNIGIALELSGLAVLDVDPRNGGNETLERVTQEHGQLPITYSVRSGGGGYHYYFRVPADVDRSQLPQKLGDGLELKKSGQIVVPPSITDDHYLVVNGSPLNLAPLPFKWVASIASDRRFGNEQLQIDDVIRMGERNERCTQLAGLLRRHGASAEFIRAALDGVGSHGFIENYDERDPLSGKTFEEEVAIIAESIGHYPQEAIHFADLKLRINEGGRQREPQVSGAHFGILSEFIELTNEYTEAHPMAVLMTALTMIGNVISPWIGFSVGKTWHPPLIYTMVVGPTSEGAKGQSESRVEELMRQVDSEWTEKITSGLSSGEGLIEAIADPTPTGDKSVVQGRRVDHVYNKGTPDKRLMIFEPELARLIKVLQRQGNTTMETLIDLWDRGFASKLTMQHRKVSNARISIVMHAPTVVVQEQMSYEWLMNGFGNRFLWCWSKRTHLEPMGWKLPFDELDPIVTHIQDAIVLLEERFERKKKPFEVGFTRRGEQLWIEMYEELAKDKYTGALETAVGRQRSYARRLATIFAALDFQTKIDVHHLTAARAIVDYNEQTLVYLFGQSTGDKLADKIYRALVDMPSGLSQTELTRDVLHGNYTRDQRNVALKKLAERGLIREQRVKRGRKSETVFIAQR